MSAWSCPPNPSEHDRAAVAILSQQSLRENGGPNRVLARRGMIKPMDFIEPMNCIGMTKTIGMAFTRRGSSC
ncbi:MAG: hypothetical protein ACP5HG_13495 [Anaerolineae bacterium]